MVLSDRRQSSGKVKIERNREEVHGLMGDRQIKNDVENERTKKMMGRTTNTYNITK